MVVKRLKIAFAVLLTASILGGCTNPNKTHSNGNKEIKIGISQLIEHPGLDATREGFIDGLKSKGFEEGKNIKIDLQNAQGDIPTTQTIAQRFVSQKMDMIMAIATPAAQAAYNTTKDIPILVTAVTDPVEAGLVKSIKEPGTNVTGTSDNISIDKQFELLKEILPNAKRVGILYNTSENNSEIQVNNAKSVAPKFGLEIVTAGITNVNDVPQALNSLIGKIDVLYTPTDNIVASSMPLISSQCFKSNIPVIGAEKAHVMSGALATNGIDYYKLGFQTGLIAVDIINGEEPKDIPIVTLDEMQLIINTDAAKKLNIDIPSELDSKGEKVTGGVN
ncbi:ABC transporter substrate-binding protein [uncultured Clostridium sp.]|uniref:ABC transporter substrate-binding protein n=1 Tax=uncultured Clostridium sp. TaxID=59620 RepID=UPI0028E8F3B4|nr:ABC transporter substrate-binding protein [uncultured Clostridium sp.]